MYLNKILRPGRHYYLGRDAAPARLGHRQASGTSNFSSPLVVKVKMLTEEHRREEVDLETGRRRSWIETQNKELIDITGEVILFGVLQLLINPYVILQVSPVVSPRKVSLRQTDPKKPTDDESSDKRVANEMSKENRMGRTKGAKEVKENQCGECGKEFKGDRGLKCHLRHPQSKCGKT